MESSHSVTKTVALRVPADGSDAELVSVSIKPRPDDDGNAEFFDDVPDLSPWLGSAFTQRRVSDFYVRNTEESSPQFPGFVRDNDTELHGKYVMYYTILSSLPINTRCVKYIGFEPEEDRLFWRGDLFVVRYKGELGMGHEYVDVPLRLERIIEDSIKSAYQRRALENVVELDGKVYDGMQKMKHPWDEAVETGALARFQTGQPMSDGDVRVMGPILRSLGLTSDK